MEIRGFNLMFLLVVFLFLMGVVSPAGFDFVVPPCASNLSECLTSPNDEDSNGPCYYDNCCRWYGDCCSIFEFDRQQSERYLEDLFYSMSCGFGESCEEVYPNPNCICYPRGHYPYVLCPCEENPDIPGTLRAELRTLDTSGSWSVIVDSFNLDRSGSTGDCGGSYDYSYVIEGWKYDNSSGGIGWPIGWGGNQPAIERIVETKNAKIFIYFDDGGFENVEISATLDPAYVVKTQSQRNFVPNKITPFDDLLIKVRVEGYNEDLGGSISTLEIDEWALDYSNCLHVFNPLSSKFNTIFMARNTSFLSRVGTLDSTNPLFLVKKSIEFIHRGFNKKQPFVFTRDYFSHSVDLFTHNYRSRNLDTLDISTRIIGMSSCGDSSRFYVYLDDLGGAAGAAQPYRKVIILNGGYLGTPEVLFHEIGHSLAGLTDEYIDWNTVVQSLAFPWIMGKNCFRSESFVLHRNFLFAGYQDLIRGCSRFNWYRASEKSLMGSGSTAAGSYNVRSCAFLLQFILEDSSSEEDYFRSLLNTCMNPSWDIIRPTRSW